MKVFGYFTPGWETGRVHSIEPVTMAAIIAGGSGLLSSGMGILGQKKPSSGPYSSWTKRLYGEELIRSRQITKIQRALMQELGFVFVNPSTGEPMNVGDVWEGQWGRKNYKLKYDPQAALGTFDYAASRSRAKALETFGSLAATTRRYGAQVSPGGPTGMLGRKAALEATRRATDVQAEILAQEPVYRLGMLQSMLGQQVQIPQTQVVQEQNPLLDIGRDLLGAGGNLWAINKITGAMGGKVSQTAAGTTPTPSMLNPAPTIGTQYGAYGYTPQITPPSFWPTTIN